MEKSRKVLYLITKATWGGAQKYVFDLSTHLPPEFEPIVAYGTPGKLTDDLRTASVRTLQIPSLQRDIAFISDIASFLAIWRCIRSEKPDVLHLNSSKAAALGAFAARIAGVKNIIFTVHGWPFGEQRNIVAKILIWKISWFTALLAHRVICVSEYDLEMAQRMPFIGRKAVRIYNGIDDVALDSSERIRSAFPKDAQITGTIGELTKNKNQQALIDAAHTNATMYVAIVGEGELRPMLEQKIKTYGLGDRVKLFGYIPAKEVLKGFDVFALPSIKEGLPYVLIEAKRAGLPILANRVGGVAEILDARDMSEFTLERMLQKTIALYIT